MICFDSARATVLTVDDLGQRGISVPSACTLCVNEGVLLAKHSTKIGHGTIARLKARAAKKGKS